MGKKFIIELEDKPFELLSEDGFTSEKLFRVKGFNSLVFDWNGLNMLTQYTEPDLEQVRKEAYEDGYKTAKIQCGIQAEKDMREVGERHYQRGLSDAWEAVRKIYDISQEDRLEIFPEASTFVVADICDRYSASECIEKIRQYEQEQDAKIKVGDEVIPRETEYDTMIVTRLWKDDYDSDCIDAIGFDGRISSFLVSRVSKTGKHYEIATILENMREGQDG